MDFLRQKDIVPNQAYMVSFHFSTHTQACIVDRCMGLVGLLSSSIFHGRICSLCEEEEWLDG